MAAVVCGLFFTNSFSMLEADSFASEGDIDVAAFNLLPEMEKYAYVNGKSDSLVAQYEKEFVDLTPTCSIDGCDPLAGLQKKYIEYFREFLLGLNLPENVLKKLLAEFAKRIASF